MEANFYCQFRASTHAVVSVVLSLVAGVPARLDFHRFAVAADAAPFAGLGADRQSRTCTEAEHAAPMAPPAAAPPNVPIPAPFSRVVNGVEQAKSPANSGRAINITTWCFIVSSCRVF